MARHARLQDSPSPSAWENGLKSLDMPSRVRPLPLSAIATRSMPVSKSHSAVIVTTPEPSPGQNLMAFPIKFVITCVARSAAGERRQGNVRRTTRKEWRTGSGRLPSITPRGRNPRAPSMMAVRGRTPRISDFICMRLILSCGSAAHGSPSVCDSQLPSRPSSAGAFHTPPALRNGIALRFTHLEAALQPDCGPRVFEDIPPGVRALGPDGEVVFVALGPAAERVLDQ